MLVLGIILLAVGIVLLLAPIPLPNTDAIGWICVLVGIVLVLVVLVLDSCSGAHCLLAPAALPGLKRRR